MADRGRIMFNFSKDGSTPDAGADDSISVIQSALTLPACADLQLQGNLTRMTSTSAPNAMGVVWK